MVRTPQGCNSKVPQGKRAPAPHPAAGPEASVMAVFKDPYVLARLKFVLPVIAGDVSISQASQQAGLCRTEVRAWTVRYKELGAEGLRNRTRPPEKRALVPRQQTMPHIGELDRSHSSGRLHLRQSPRPTPPAIGRPASLPSLSR